MLGSICNFSYLNSIRLIFLINFLSFNKLKDEKEFNNKSMVEEDYTSIYFKKLI